MDAPARVARIAIAIIQTNHTEYVVPTIAEIAPFCYGQVHTLGSRGAALDDGDDRRILEALDYEGVAPPNHPRNSRRFLPESDGTTYQLAIAGPCAWESLVGGPQVQGHRQEDERKCG